ncbi:MULTISPECIES: phospholipase D-like domain-containing protein [unclassified Variovorax]|uniref:phospholipase D-like domain-containing protein n=1 Tax=unclassified Variovorax TaxID=663243 RepID=UPI00076CDA69|nr:MULTISPECIES: phospholipase D-like domain-containing protein [unclassified Variovorax]KWT97376.1 Cardiolipin synthetase [Variovorax sp. WDL1]PNG60048.1 putative cardiolipin synthase YwiE [Variovorax sp. B4]PNG60159.1 putative cardiolipin synthase YwiE [Variovorax sp. B2]VTV14020.1 putative cardiolipin synthase YwiE [Variovorax sp. WDL1]
MKRRIKLIAWTFVLTVAAAVIVLNFTGGEKKLEEQVRHEYALHDEQYQRALGVLLGPAITDGNRFEALHNGDRIFPSMLAAIRGARHSITFETYIYWSGDIGKAFADALAERSRAGVKVHVLLDWVGSSKVDEAFLTEMQAAGVQIRKFHKPSWYDLTKMNNRTHRKLLVVDGRIGFTGGVGIAPEWTGDAQDAAHWRDSHFKAEGPVVAQMQAVFMDNWVKATGDVLHGEIYFPALAEVGRQRAQVFSSSPSGGSESMQLMYLLSIAAATRSIDLSSAYFVPDELTVRALVEAMRRGVRLRVITPGPIIDSQTVRAASRAGWGPLLEAGAEISEYQPTMFHCKVFLADGLLVSVGSTNFDNRSFRLNDEANLNIYDAAFAAEQTAQFEADLKQAKRVTLEAWRNRPWSEKAQEHLAALLGSQL